jgi:hypothetical protein
MDVPPAGTPNGRTVVLFHGLKFGGFYFKSPIDALRMPTSARHRPRPDRVRTFLAAIISFLIQLDGG